MRSPRHPELSGGKRFSIYRVSSIALGLSVLGVFGVLAIYASSPTSPVGPTGNWALAFSDEFDGSSLDRTKWDANWYGEGGTMNGVGTYAANTTVSGGTANLVLASSGSGALIHTNYSSGRYALPVGSYVEARVQFAGSGSTCYNWSAWWASGPNWPSAGEHDIAEVLSSQLTVNYHSPSGAHNQGAIPGSWCGAFHTYGVWRKAGTAEVYWDGVKVKSYATSDNGGAEELIFNVGKGSSYGSAGMMKIDWVRAWKPSSTPFSPSPTATATPTPTPTPTSTPTPTPTPTATPTPTGSLPGDINHNGKVDVFDLSTLLSRWGTADTACDINKDGTVNVFDLSLLLANWGKNVSAL